eukprot:TRINITY_DN2527_c0_g1_i1.p1 TRINITY_DN2527_c0_g1~~TRINITY_DN2527_c0_g1_i1.p1  ORF type:complete len:1299 (-),score=392.85 TRINITY_DN2527_c0_g1_i1:105-4001(-)
MLGVSCEIYAEDPSESTAMGKVWIERPVAIHNQIFALSFDAIDPQECTSVHLVCFSVASRTEENVLVWNRADTERPSASSQSSPSEPEGEEARKSILCSIVASLFSSGNASHIINTARTFELHVFHAKVHFSGDRADVSCSVNVSPAGANRVSLVAQERLLIPQKEDERATMTSGGDNPAELFGSLGELLREFPHPMLVLGPKQDIIEANRAACELFNYSREEFLGAQERDIITPSERASELAHVVTERLGKDGRHSFESVRLSRNGTEIPVRIHCILLQSGAVFCIYEPTRKDRACKEDLGRNERLNRLYFDAAPVGIWILDERAHFIDCNIDACRLTGYNKEEMMALSIPDLTPGDRLELFQQAKTDDAVSADVYLRKKDGNEIVVMLKAKQLSEKLSIAYCVDITEKRKMEKALKDSEKRFRSIFDVSEDGIVIVDENMDIILVNPMICKMSGYDDDKLHNMNLEAILVEGYSTSSCGSKSPGQVISRIDEISLKIIPLFSGDEDQTCRFESRIRHIGSECVVDVDVQGKRIHFMEKSLVMLSMRDVSETRLIQRERDRHLAALRQGEELASLGYFEKNLESGVIYWSPGFRHILGLPSDAENASSFEDSRVDEDGVLNEEDIPIDISGLDEMRRGSIQHIEKLIPFVQKEYEMQVRDQLFSAIRTGERMAIDIQLDVGTGDEQRTRTMHGTIECSKDADGNPCTIRGVLEDVTDLRETLIALELSEEKYRQFVENATEGIVLFNRDQMCIDANDAACIMLCYDKEDLLKCHLSDFIPRREDQSKEGASKAANYSDKEHAIDDACSASSGAFPVFSGEAVLISKVGEHIPTFVSSMTLSPECSLFFLYDLREQKKVEKEKQSLELQLQQFQRMESIGRLAGGVAHDFNNLLTAIIGNVSLLQMDLENDEKFLPPLTQIREAADRAADLTRQLLAFSRKQTIQPRPLDMNTILSDMEDMISHVITESMKLHFEMSPSSVWFKGDPGQMHQVIMNLVVNARDAMRSGGHLFLSVFRVLPVDDGQARDRRRHRETGSGVSVNMYSGRTMFEMDPSGSGSIVVGREFVDPEDRRNMWDAKDGYVCLEIRDTGVGMEADVLQNIFEPFFTTKGEYQGSGLGLATVYGIVRQHSGHIEVFSAVGEGTTFRLYFPAMESEVHHRDLKKTKQHMGPKKRHHGDETILLVEDDLIVQKIAVKSLRRHGYKVYPANDGVDALRVVEEKNIDVDLLLTDVVMPNMNGAELAEELVQLQPTVKVLFTSGYAEEIIAHHGVIDTSMNFIGKPYSPAAICKRVREVLDS